jgi:hypothetical protein
MNNPFTVHCIAWQAGAPLLQDIRVTASEMGLTEKLGALADKLDDQCRHALALSTSGRAIGCARITPDGRIERVVVLPHEHRAQIEAAMIEVLNDYSLQIDAGHVAARGSKGKTLSNRMEDR